MTLKQLEAFYWAATCTNFSVAARRLNLSISSLSKRIAELEESLGRVLFDRSGHKAALTDEGRQLLPGARQLLGAAEALRDAAGGQRGLSGHCRFGVGELSALTWLPRLMAQARKLHPNLVLEPYVDVGAVLEQRVDKGELDFAVIAGRSSRQTMASEPIAHAHFAWTASPSLVGRSGKMTGALLQAHPLVSLPSGAGTTRIIDDWLLSQGADAGERITCNSLGAVAGLLVEGVGVGLLPKGWADKLAKRGQLRKLNSPTELQPLTYSCQWRRGDARPAIKQMCELARQVADFSPSGIFL